MISVLDLRKNPDFRSEVALWQVGEIGLGGGMVTGSEVSPTRKYSKPEKTSSLSVADAADHLPSVCSLSIYL